VHYDFQTILGPEQRQSPKIVYLSSDIILLLSVTLYFTGFHFWTCETLQRGLFAENLELTCRKSCVMQLGLGFDLRANVLNAKISSCKTKAKNFAPSSVHL